MIIDFEKRLCDRIADICDDTSLYFTAESQIQEKLAMASFFKGQYVNNKFVGYSVSCERGEYSAKYYDSKVSVSCLTDGSRNSKINELNKLLNTYKNNVEDKWPPKVDLFYESFTDRNRYLLEIKFPKDWGYVCGNNTSFESKYIFDAPVFEFYEDKYYTDAQEGKMFTDFVRMLNIKRTHSASDLHLYFCAFFRQANLDKKTKERFCDKLNDIIAFYLNGNNILFTRGKQVDVWDYEQCDLSFFKRSASGYEKVGCSPTAPSSCILHDGKQLFAFLVKLETP